MHWVWSVSSFYTLFEQKNSQISKITFQWLYYYNIIIVTYRVYRSVLISNITWCDKTLHTQTRGFFSLFFSPGGWGLSHVGYGWTPGLWTGIFNGKVDEFVFRPADHCRRRSDEEIYFVYFYRYGGRTVAWRDRLYCTASNDNITYYYYYIIFVFHVDACRSYP